MNAPLNDLVDLLKASDAFIERQDAESRRAFYEAVGRVKRAEALPVRRRPAPRRTRTLLAVLLAAIIILIIVVLLFFGRAILPGFPPRATDTATQTSTNMPTVTPSYTATATPTATNTPTAKPTATPSATPTETATSTATLTATATLTLMVPPSPSYTPTSTATSTSISAQVVSGAISAKPANYSGNCPTGVTISGQLNTQGEGPITYRWERSDGRKGQPITVTAKGPTDKIFTSVVSQVANSGSFVETLRVLSPNSMVFTTPFTANCTTAPPQQPPPPAPGATTPAPQQQPPPPQQSSTVTGVKASVKPASYKGSCPMTFTFTGDIVTNGPVSVTYRWERSDGAVGGPQILTANGAGDQYVQTSWTIGDKGQFSGYDVLHVLQPVDMYSDKSATTFFEDCQ
jgi:hypothetical protein